MARCYNKHMDKVSPLRIWTPRILSIAFILFLMMFSLDVFEASSSTGEIAVGLLIHNIPALILAAVVAISWKYEIVGGIVFTLASIIYVAMVLTAGRFEASAWTPSLVIGAPAVLIGILFLSNWVKKKKIKNL